MSGAKRHKHEFSALWSHFGPHGRQDVHVHSCYRGEWIGDPAPAPDFERCDRVLIGAGRDCDGKAESHHRETLRG